MPTDRSPGAATGAAGLTIEGIVAVESPREFRVNPRERTVAYTAEMAGARQLFTLSLRGMGAPATQITASEKAIGEPQWSPDGRRLAFVRDEEIWIVEADGSLCTPSMLAAEIGRVQGINPPSVGAISAVFERWVAIGFANISKKPTRFESYTPQGVQIGLDGCKEKAKRGKKLKQSAEGRRI